MPNNILAFFYLTVSFPSKCKSFFSVFAGNWGKTHILCLTILTSSINEWKNLANGHKKHLNFTSYSWFCVTGMLMPINLHLHLFNHTEHAKLADCLLESLTTLICVLVALPFHLNGHITVYVYTLHYLAPTW